MACQVLGVARSSYYYQPTELPDEAELRKAIKPILRDQLIYEYIGKNRRRLLPEAQGTRQNSFPVGTLEGLVGLYQGG